VSNNGDALQPRNPDYERLVRDSFARQGLLRQLGAWMVEVAPGRVVIELPFAARITQQQGLFHGAAIAAIGDSAGGYAALSLMPAGSEVVTIEYKVNFVRPAKGALLRAVGEVVRAGRSVSVARIDVAICEGDRRETCALLQASFMRIEAGPATA
jgi:uncharacterized protein (TIGR00369 family)